MYWYTSALPWSGVANGLSQATENGWPNTTFMFIHLDFLAHLRSSFFSCSIPCRRIGRYDRREQIWFSRTTHIIQSWWKTETTSNHEDTNVSSKSNEPRENKQWMGLETCWSISLFFLMIRVQWLTTSISWSVGTNTHSLRARQALTDIDRKIWSL